MRKAFQTFIAWKQAMSGAIAGVVAIDGKTARPSFDRAGDKGAIHLVSAWSSRQKLVLGARAVDEKSMGCQKKIAEKIIAKGADYVFGLKGNQTTLRTDVEDLFTEQMACNFKDVAVSRAIGTEAGHGRIETREVFAVGDIAWLRQNHEWAGLRFIIMGSPAGKHKRALSGNGASTSPRCRRRRKTRVRHPSTLGRGECSALGPGRQFPGR
jgi:predicted transposase YbfD/YdcC